MSSKCCRWLCTLLVLAASGCAMCSNCDDYTYAASGGLWERLDPTYGRVGSAFTPEVGVRNDDLVVEATEPESVEAGEPTPAENPTPMPEQEGENPESTESDGTDVPEPSGEMESPVQETPVPETPVPETSVLQDDAVFGR